MTTEEKLGRMVETLGWERIKRSGLFPGRITGEHKDLPHDGRCLIPDLLHSLDDLNAGGGPVEWLNDAEYAIWICPKNVHIFCPNCPDECVVTYDDSITDPVKRKAAALFEACWRVMEEK